MTYVVCLRSVSEFCRENINEFSVSPSLLTVGIVGKVIGMDFSQAVLKVISRRRVAGSNNRRRSGKFLWLGFGTYYLLESYERHVGRC